MLRLFVVFGLFALGSLSPLLASIDVDQVVAKIQSSECNSNGVTYKGSGILFSHDGKTYFLTSDHVVLHSNDGICHVLYNKSVGNLNATLLFADWGIGIALLEVPQFKNNIELPTLGEYIDGDVSKNEPVVVSGFPYDSYDLPEEESGRVKFVESSRHILPKQGKVIEVKTTHNGGEFGMSGGPVFDQSKAKIVGLLSHQYIEIVQGGKSAVGSHSPASGIKNNLLVIAGKEIKSILKSYFTNPEKFRIHFERKAVDQLVGERAVYSDGLAYHATELVGECSDDSNAVGAIGGDGAGVGGDGAGVGGDGAGVGGISTATDSRIRIKITPQASSVKTKWYLGHSPWLKNLTRKLLLRHEVEVKYLMFEDAKTKKRYKLCFSSLGEFFRKLSFKSVRPIFFVNGGIDGVDSDEVVKELNDTADRLRLVLNAIEVDAIDTKNSGRVRLFVKKVGETLQKLSSSDWLFVTPKDLRDLSALEGQYYKEWNALVGLYFDEVIELTRGLKSLQVLLEKISI